MVFGGAGGTAWEGAKGDQLKSQIPTGRFAYPEEIAGRQCSVSGSIATPILDIGFRCRITISEPQLSDARQLNDCVA